MDEYIGITSEFSKKGENKQKNQRTSNLELFRISTMLLIIAHHYVVNSGLIASNGPIYENPLSWKSIFLLLFGAWGKIGINCFILITGYFMCTSQITAKKYIKLIFEVMFYRIVFFIIFLISGYETFGMKNLVNAIFPITSIEQGFTSCYLIFYLCIPFLNILIQHLTEKQHIYLIILLSYIYIFFGTIKVLNVDMNYVSWFVVLYLIASYIRLYPKKIFENFLLWKILSIGTIFISAISVVICTWIGTKIDKQLSYFFVTDSNTFLAVITAISAFLFFKNLKLKNNKFINIIASSTFGVLLIHANSNTMRRWLWQDVLDNVEVYDTAWLVLHAVLSVLIIYSICTYIDYLRIRYIEKLFLKIWDKYWDKFVLKYKIIEGIICKKLQIKID